MQRLAGQPMRLGSLLTLWEQCCHKRGVVVRGARLDVRGPAHHIVAVTHSGGTCTQKGMPWALPTTTCSVQCFYEGLVAAVNHQPHRSIVPESGCVPEEPLKLTISPCLVACIPQDSSATRLQVASQAKDCSCCCYCPRLAIRGQGP